jgi:glycine oxidase
MEERGYDRTVQAGAVHQLLSDARAAVPGIDELELEECTAGLRPGTPDNGPVVGWSAVDGLLLATGHGRNGILLAPLTATAVATLLAGGRIEGPLSRFGPERFGTGSSGTGHVETGHVESGRAETGHVETGRAGAGRAQSARPAT